MSLTINQIDTIYDLEPVKLNGKGEYNLNILKEIKTTDSFHGLDEHVRGCQNDESFVCTTRQYVDTFLGQCGCLPLSMRLSDKVYLIILNNK